MEERGIVMKHNNIRRGLAGLLAALTLVQGGALTTLAAEVETTQVTEQAVTLADTQLQNGTALIPAGADAAAVKQALFDALVINKEGIDPQSLEWEYYCTGKDVTTGLVPHDAWGAIDGFSSQTVKTIDLGIFGKKDVVTTYTHPALADNEDGNYQVRLEGTTAEVTLTKAAKLSSSITLKEGCKVALPYNEDTTVDYDALRENIFNAVVASKTPSDLTVDDVTIEYWAENVVFGQPGGTYAWMPLEGGKSDLREFPPISAGEQKIRVSYAGTDTVYGTSAEATITIAERPEADIVVNENPTVLLTVDESLNLNISQLYQDMFDAIIKSSTPELSLDDVTITYYAENVVLGKPAGTYAWMPLEGGKSDIREFPAIPAGDQKVRIYFAGNSQYAPTTIETTVTVKDREQVKFNLKDAPYEVGMVFDDEQGYDYAATAAAIYNAVVASTTPVSFSAEDVTVEYNADPTGLTDSYKSLDWTGSTGLLKFGTGEWKIRISVAGTQTYRGNHVDVTVTTTDNRAASAVVLKEGASFTYNMDAKVMKQAIFDNAIDWENSTLPAKDTLSLDNFVIEYYGEAVLFDGGIDSGIKGWAPIEGKKYEVLGQVLGQFPQMGAGEQSIRVSYKGNADYRPSENAQSTVTVNKAKVSVKVNSTNIYADETLPNDFITTNPADKFDLYTIYAGITSNVTTGLYLDLPERYTDSAILKLLDPIVEKIYGKSFTQMMNDGVTVGELRKLFSTQELLDLLDKLNIDTGTFGKILETINNLPGILDSVRVAFGTPNRAGLYTVAAVTDNQNYETGVGIGFLLVKMRFSGPKLTWDQEIPGGKLTAEQAKTFDFGATLFYEGVEVKDQSSVHYLYSGFTSKWRVYSSTTTPPTEPGRYVVTVCILGGNYMAAPITRSFQITK